MLTAPLEDINQLGVEANALQPASGEQACFPFGEFGRTGQGTGSDAGPGMPWAVSVPKLISLEHHLWDLNRVCPCFLFARGPAGRKPRRRKQSGGGSRGHSARSELEDAYQGWHSELSSLQKPLHTLDTRLHFRPA